MIDGRFDQHFLEIFAKAEPRDTDAGLSALMLGLVLLMLTTAALLLA